VSDYIPTTDEVRDGYYSPRESYEPDHNAEFDRWLAQHDAEIAAQAEQRIIKLLEDPVVMSNWWSQVDKNIGLYGNLKNYVIALINGENK
jgi:hypothetical protein